MTSVTLDADRVYTIKLRSYGFVHAGQERQVSQVLKRTWPLIPGSTLYGAIAAALHRLDPQAEGHPDRVDYTQGRGDYFALLRAVAARQIRFTPLLPATTTLNSGQAYCEQASRLLTRKQFSQSSSEPPLFHTSPGAPISRHSEQIHEDQLFSLRSHRAGLDYYGFIFSKAENEPWLRKAFRYFPMLPFGGKGKFALVEGGLHHVQDKGQFAADLQGWIEPQGNAQPARWLSLLTPMVLAQTNHDLLHTRYTTEIEMRGQRRYRVWRTGRYLKGGTLAPPVGIGPYFGPTDEADPIPRADGTESVAVQALPEASRFCLTDAGINEATRWFIEGTGDPDWGYLGWGQVVIE